MRRMPCLVFIGLGCLWAAATSQAQVDCSVNGDVVECTATSASDLPLLPTNATFLSLAFTTGTSISLGPDVLPAMPETQVLTLDMLNLNGLQAGGFINLPDLGKLVLINTDIYVPREDKPLADGAFQGLDNVTTLQAIHIGVNSIGAAVFSDLPKLTTLDLTQNKLSSLPDLAFSTNAALVSLNMDQNELTALTATTLSGLSGLTELIITDNQLSQITPGAFQDLSSLTSLRLSNNQLQTLENATFQGLLSCTILDLDHNSIDALKVGIFSDLGKLETLDLNDNQISLIEDGALDGLVSLEYLKLFNNHLSSVSSDVFSGLTSLIYLNLHGNSIHTLGTSSFASIPELTILHLHQNNLSTVAADALEGLSHLSVLTLHDNQLTTLEESVLLNQTAVSLLDLSNNLWHCDCNLTWLDAWLARQASSDSGLFFQLDHATDTLCTSPNSTQGQLLQDFLQQNYYPCNPTIAPPLLTEETTMLSNATSISSRLSAEIRYGIVAGCILLAILLVLITAIFIYCRHKRYAFWQPEVAPQPDPEIDDKKKRELLTHFSRYRLPIMYMQDHDSNSLASRQSKDSKQSVESVSKFSRDSKRSKESMRSRDSKRSRESKRSKASKNSRDLYGYDNGGMVNDDNIASIVVGDDKKLEAIVLKDAELGAIVVGRGSTAETLPQDRLSTSTVASDDSSEDLPPVNEAPKSSLVEDNQASTPISYTNPAYDDSMEDPLPPPPSHEELATHEYMELHAVDTPAPNEIPEAHPESRSSSSSSLPQPPEAEAGYPVAASADSLGSNSPHDSPYMSSSEEQRLGQQYYAQV